MSFELELERLKAEYQEAKRAYDQSTSQKDFERLKWSLRAWSELKKLTKAESLIGLPQDEDMVKVYHLKWNALVDRFTELKVEELDFPKKGVEEFTEDLDNIRELGQMKFTKETDRLLNEFELMLQMIWKETP